MSASTDGGERLIESYRERTLDGTFPDLKQYLKPGIKVLDVGCGPGTITLDVARAVQPGEVVGIDPGQSRIELAQETARKLNINNVTFTAGDAHQIDLPDDTFDVVYSHTVAHHFIDPVRALKEQKRAAKKGGRVIAAGVRDWTFSQRYPLCPALDEVWDTLRRYCDSLQSQYESGKRIRGPLERKVPESYYLNIDAGRQCPEWFSMAGLTDLDVRVTVAEVLYQGADDMEPGFLDILPLLYPVGGSPSELCEDMLTEAFLDKELLERAWHEIEAWYQHPHAFHFWSFVTAVGRA